jgi:hypothetical protein
MRSHRGWTAVLGAGGLAGLLLLSSQLPAGAEKKASKDSAVTNKGEVEKLIQDLRQEIKDLRKEVKDLHQRLEALEKNRLPAGPLGQPGFGPPNVPPFPIPGGGVGGFGGNFGPAPQAVKVAKVLQDQKKLVLQVEQPNQFQAGQTFMAHRRGQAGPPLGFLKITQIKEKEKEVVAELQPLPIPGGVGAPPGFAPETVRAGEELQLIPVPSGAGAGGFGLPGGPPPGAPGAPPGFIPPGAPGVPPGPFPPGAAPPPAPLRD